MSNKVLVALSGGVDSSVSALLLKERGFLVEAAFMKNWDETLAPEFYNNSDSGCSTKADQEDARAVCKQLGVPFHIFNFTKEYYSRVIENFFKEYKVGRTPNPDVLCNKYIKFGQFLDKALKMGFDYIATGHYVRKSKVKSQKLKVNYRLLKGQDDSKDQSYFLWTLTQEQIRHCMFPVGEYEKSEIRRIAEQNDLVTAKKPDSQGICFVGEVDVQRFLESELGKNPGPIVTVDGDVIGEHEGLYFYTEGQRKGIRIGGSGLPYYVVRKDIENNRLIVAKGAHHPSLYSSNIYASFAHWIAGASPEFPLKCKAKIRYRQKEFECKIQSVSENSLIVNFLEPQRAATQGQSIVFYDGDQCIGGGIIQERISTKPE